MSGYSSLSSSLPSASALSFALALALAMHAETAPRLVREHPWRPLLFDTKLTQAPANDGDAALSILLLVRQGINTMLPDDVPQTISSDHPLCNARMETKAPSMVSEARSHVHHKLPQ